MTLPMYPQFYETQILVVVRGDSREELTRQKILFYKISDLVSAMSVKFLDISAIEMDELAAEIVKTALKLNISSVAIENLSVFASSTNDAQAIIRILLNSNIKVFTPSSTIPPLIQLQAYPKIISATPLDDYKLSVVFECGIKKIYDCRPLLTNGIFKPLKDLELFRKIIVSAGGYGVEWNQEIDLSEAELYTNGI